MPWTAVVGAVASGVVNSALSDDGGGGGGQSETSRQIDPRLARHVYGENGSGGLIDQIMALYNQNPSGLNAQMAQGLNDMYGVYTNPATRQGQTAIQNTGLGLLNGTIGVGNPFSQGGRMGNYGTMTPRGILGNQQMPAGLLGQQGAPTPAPSPALLTYAPVSTDTPGPFSAAPAPAPATPAPAPAVATPGDAYRRLPAGIDPSMYYLQDNDPDADDMLARIVARNTRWNNTHY